MYPRHEQLISINKRHTGKTNKEFNLRHDWNSLLSDDETLQFRHYSRDYFPHRQALVDYLADYARKLELRIRYNTTVVDISQTAETGAEDEQDEEQEDGEARGTRINVIVDDEGNEFRCR